MTTPERKYRVEIQSMMYVSGEIADPLPEVTGLVEDIVRSQVVELLLCATQQSARRGSRSIGVEDLIFIIRGDKAKVSRLRNYLSWKDVRKNAKEEGGGGDTEANLLDDPATTNAPGGPVAAPGKIRKAKVRLPWDLSSIIPIESLHDPDNPEEEDEEDIEANQATLERLKNADERTRVMSRDEYVHWSECRQASFTYRKSKRFREWCGMGAVVETKPSDEIVDILGFLTFEMVTTITEEALKVRATEQLLQGQEGGRKGRKKEPGLFDGPEEGVEPLQIRHVEEAYRRLQRVGKGRGLRTFQGGLVRSRVTLI
ncbi:TFIID-18kDa-domain-containing protein [Saitoella complicata NRRL Y-17804]|uniref:Uncharacterized protein n=1 Tax=Saitoella complicata (strain BCRC 22490 / CBS 7301 / JCM 7358 / NBRC 10748 / NRRL Y-17804) TaxID=698492 RepID=A0A0E9NQ29_SAICN|nr:TFIID-18kDa-domain-containing protein [Saitoella complicata NRRL Y-17804]ODQ54708.1 TFIID-18kDa-domain-containing protein [Saitoella complicata NRRL Y-17804]GAO51939.1 hypothetical protein G7K_6027-t1 [Saitoella complicata NRRL Y-17804]